MRPGWTLVHTLCEAHCTAKIFNSTLEGLAGKHITGMIACALSLRQAGGLSLFRESLRMEVQSRLIILRGQPSREAVEYRCNVLKLLLAGGHVKSIVQTMLLSLLPNGDWRHHQIEHFVTADPETVDKKQLALTMERGMMEALIARRPAVWCRHRWTGASTALSELALLECVHRLLSTTFRRFAERCSNPRLGLAISMHPHHAPATRPGPQQISVGQVAGEGLLPAGPGAASSEGDPQAPVDMVWADPDLPQDAAGADFAVQNARDRRQALGWLAEDPLPFLFIFKTVMMPLDGLLERQLKNCGEDFETEQRAAAARRVMQGNSHTGLLREYMITIAAEGKHEKQFFLELRRLFRQRDAWMLVPDTQRTLATNHLCFCMLSRQGAMVQCKIAHTHQTFPIKLFRLLGDRGLAGELSRSPLCTMDTFSQTLLAKFPGFQDAACWKILEMIASHAATNTAKVEATHASVRRHVCVRSTHTWAQQVTKLSAEFYLQKLRRARARTCMRSGASTQADRVGRKVGPRRKTQDQE